MCCDVNYPGNLILTNPSVALDVRRDVTKMNVKEAVNTGLTKLGFKEIREIQQNVVAYVSGRDVLMVALTGSGTFHTAPFVLDYFKHGERDVIETVCLVIFLLVSLMHDQSVEPSRERASTKYKNKWAVNIFAEWQRLREVKVLVSDCGGLFKDYDLHKVTAVSADIAGIDALSLNYWLSKFVMEVAKKSGERYPPKSVYGIICALKRYLEEKNGSEALNPLDASDKRFVLFRRCLDAEMKNGVREGLNINDVQRNSGEQGNGDKTSRRVYLLRPTGEVLEEQLR
ncbi:hypothetical protein ACROYT_G014053 [Oculina patagonica]